MNDHETKRATFTTVKNTKWCVYLRIEIQIFSFHWMMKNIRLF